jgi:hypothetical protein
LKEREIVLLTSVQVHEFRWEFAQEQLPYKRMEELDSWLERWREG